jgi:hypothetical protein
MHTRWLMSLSAIFMALLGLAASFLPSQALVWLGSDPAMGSLILVQVTGALYLGFAILNWSARGVLIGGIYARPVGIGNLLHFAVVAAMLLRAAGQMITPVAWAVTAFYTVFAVWFAAVVFGNPLRGRDNGDDV